MLGGRTGQSSSAWPTSVYSAVAAAAVINPLLNQSVLWAAVIVAGLLKGFVREPHAVKSCGLSMPVM
jgi:hypothetical protein